MCSAYRIFESSFVSYFDSYKTNCQKQIDFTNLRDIRKNNDRNRQKRQNKNYVSHIYLLFAFRINAAFNLNLIRISHSKQKKLIRKNSARLFEFKSYQKNLVCYWQYFGWNRIENRQMTCFDVFLQLKFLQWLVNYKKANLVESETRFWIASIVSHMHRHWIFCLLKSN